MLKNSEHGNRTKSNLQIQKNTVIKQNGLFSSALNDLHINIQIILLILKYITNNNKIILRAYFNG